MYSTPENYETIMTGARNIWYEGTITTVAEDVYEFDASNIVTGTGSINRRITDGTSLAIGSVTAAQFDIKLYWQNIDRYELYDAEISVTCYIGNGDQSPIEIPMGIFYINEVTQDATTVSITAYDAMLKFDALYIHTVANKTPYEWLTAWCSTCEVELGSTVEQIRNMPNGTLSMTLDIDSVSDISTFRDALSYLCTVLCAVAVIGRDGKLYIVNYGTTPAKTFNQSQRYSSTLSDYVCYYTHLTSVYGETVENYVDTSYSGEDDGITLDIDINPFLQITDADTRNAACQAILTKLASVHYAPYEVSLPARPELDIMDVIGFAGGQADAQDFGAIMDITYNFHSSMSISCAGDNPKTIKENKYVKTIKNVSRLAKQNDDFAGLLANAYGMFRTEIEDPVIEGAYAYALHNASTYNTSTFAVLLDADGLFMLTRDTVYDDWDIASITASDGAAFIETLTANMAVINTIFSQDITVSGALHSEDYIPAATGASPPYAQRGMGLDFGEKEFEAEKFAVDANGRMWATEGKIGPFHIGEITEGNVTRPALYTDWYVYQNGIYYDRTRILLSAPYLTNNMPMLWTETEFSLDYDPDNPESATWEKSSNLADPRVDILSNGFAVFKNVESDEGASVSINTTWGLDFYQYPNNASDSPNDTIGAIVSDYYNGVYGLMLQGDNWLKLFSSGGIQLASTTTADANIIGNNYNIIAKDKSVKSLTTVSANHYGTGFYLRDNGDYDVSYLRHVFLTDKRQGVQLETRAVISGATKYNTVNLFINNSTGEKTVQLSDPHAWCKAMLADHVTAPTSFFTLTDNHASCGWTSRLEAAKALTNENVGTGAQYFVTLTNNWGKFGYSNTASARTVLGAATQLYSGTLKSGSTTFNYGSYNYYLVLGRCGGSMIQSLLIPKVYIGTGNTTFIFADESCYLSFLMKYSGTTCTLTFGVNKDQAGATITTGAVFRVWGVM